MDSSLTFSAHLTNLTSSSYFHLWRLRAICRSVFLSTVTSTVHAFVCSRIDYCNSLLIGLSKVRVCPIQSVLNAAARLIAHLPKWSNILLFMVNQLHWLHHSDRIQFKGLTLVVKSKLGLAPKYLRDLIRPPLSESSHRPLRSVDQSGACHVGQLQIMYIFMSLTSIMILYSFSTTQYPEVHVSIQKISP